MQDISLFPRISAFKTYTFLHDGESLYSDWANTPSTEKLAETQIKLNVPNNKWHAMHITLTANPKYIVSHLNTQGILDMTKKLDKNFDAEKRISKMFSFAPQNWKQEIMTMKDVAQQQRNTALLRLINQCSTVVNSEFNRSLFSMLLQNAYLTRNNLGIVACDFINQQKVLSILLYNLISYVDRSNLNNEI